jgi:hypothetical protein
VGTVLSGGRAGVGGRKTRDIEAATELHLVAEPRPGSLTLELALSPEPEAIPGAEQPHLGQRALSAENDGLRWPRRDGLKWPHLASVVVSG